MTWVVETVPGDSWAEHSYSGIEVKEMKKRLSLHFVNGRRLVEYVQGLPVYTTKVYTKRELKRIKALEALILAELADEGE